MAKKWQSMAKRSLLILAIVVLLGVLGFKTYETFALQKMGVGAPIALDVSGSFQETCSSCGLVKVNTTADKSNLFLRCDCKDKKGVLKKTSVPIKVSGVTNVNGKLVA
jgi:hypothetical protein